MRLGGSNNQLVGTPSSRPESMTHLLHLRYTFSYRTESDMTNFKLCLLRKPLIPREEWGTTDSRGGIGDYRFQGENGGLQIPGGEWRTTDSRGENGGLHIPGGELGFEHEQQCFRIQDIWQELWSRSLNMEDLNGDMQRVSRSSLESSHI